MSKYEQVTLKNYYIIEKGRQDPSGAMILSRRKEPSSFIAPKSEEMHTYCKKAE